jgi:hypothetical protein
LIVLHSTDIKPEAVVAEDPEVEIDRWRFRRAIELRSDFQVPGAIEDEVPGG